MRVLIDIVHPADVLFFWHSIRLLQARGADLLILSRRKDVACELLDEFGLAHIPVSVAGTGTVGLARELVARDLAVLRAARRFKPDVMIGLGGVSISHVGRLIGIPSIAFYFADTARLQTRITWPFIAHLYVPETYAGPVPARRTTRFRGVKELSYLHPENFIPARTIALDAGLDPGRDNFLVRLVAWRANHDLGKTGWSDDKLRTVVADLSAPGRVHISSERPLPADLAAYAYAGRVTAMHHFLAHCRLYVGESATMAHEAAMLGVPAIYDGQDHPGTTRELASEGLIARFRDAPAADLSDCAAHLLAEPPETFRLRLDRYVTERPNLAEYIVDAVTAHALHPSPRPIPA